MRRREFVFHGLALLLVLTACAVRPPRPLAACMPLEPDGLQNCLDAAPAHTTFALDPGRYLVTRPLVLSRPVTLTTAGAPDCATGACATLVLRIAGPGRAAARAVTLAAPGIVLDHIAVEGGRADPTRDDQPACSGPGRPSMGGLAVTASDVTIRNSRVSAVSCYTAVQVDAGANRLRFEDNQVLSNGTHDSRAMWSDGLTVIDGDHDTIRGNLFRDNTDVQLVLGGCRACLVAGNRIETTEAPGAGAFAGLLIHAWPLSSGDYTGTLVTANTVDCGPARNCAFGLGIGGRAWYASPTAGGRVTANRITRAQVGINVDDATGPVAMDANTVTLSGGPVRSRCGLTFAGPVNISPRSRPFVDGTAGVAMPVEAVTDRTFAGCLPGL